MTLTLIVIFLLLLYTSLKLIINHNTILCLALTIPIGEILLVLSLVPTFILTDSNKSMIYQVTLSVLIIAMGIFAIIRKKELHNITETNQYLLTLLALSTIGIVLRCYSKEIWDGDGMGIWASRGLEWARTGRLQYTEQTLLHFKTWINYPIFHSLKATSSILIFKSQPALFSSNLFDIFSSLGLITSSFYLISIYTSKNNNIIVLGLLFAFSCRTFHSIIGSFYSDTSLTYYHLLAFSILWKQQVLKQSKFNWWVMLPISLLCFSKNEGIFRAIILLGTFLLYSENKKKIALIMILLIPVQKTFKLLNPSEISYEHYLSDISISLDILVTRSILIGKAMLLSLFRLESNFFKSPVFFLNTGAILALIFNNWTKEIRILLSLYLLNISFNCAPLILTSIDGDVFNNVDMIANQIFNRLNMQFFFIPTLIIFHKDLIRLGSGEYVILVPFQKFLKKTSFL